MVDAGIHTPDEVLAAFKEMQIKNKFHYIIFGIKNKKHVYVDHSAEQEAEEWDWDNFVEKLSESGEPRFATVDFHYKSKDGLDKTKLLFVAWTPETSRPGDKMLYASTKEGFKNKLDGVQKVLQANDEAELEYDHVQGVVESL